MEDNLDADGVPLTAAQEAELNRRLETLEQDQREGIAREQLRADLFDALSGRIVAAFAEVPVEEGLAEIDAVVAEERAR